MSSNLDLEELKIEKRRRLEQRLAELESKKSDVSVKSIGESFLNKEGLEDYMGRAAELGRGAVQGAADLAISPINLARRAYSYAKGEAQPTPYDVDLFGQSKYPTERSLGQLISPVPFVGKTSAIAKLFERLSPNLAGKLLGSAAQGAAIGGPLAGLLAANKPGSDIPSEALTGASYGAALSPALSAIFGGPSAAGKLLKNLAGGRNTPEQIEKAVSYIPEGLSAPLGEVINSPALTSIQKGLLKNIPFSGMGEVYNKLNAHARDRSNSIFNEISGGGLPENISADIFAKAKDKYLEVKKDVNDLYSDFNKKALSSNIKFDDSFLKKTIKEESDKLDLSKYRTGIIGPIRKFKKDLKFYSQKKVTNFSDLEEIRRQLNDHYSLAMKEGDKLAMRTLASIKGKIKETVTLNAMKDPSVYEALKKADNMYIEEQIPFEVSGKASSTGVSRPSSFYKLSKYKNPNTSGFISDYLKPTIKNDDSRSIDDLLRMLPDQESRDQVAAFHLKDAHDKDYGVSPVKLLNRYKTLGEKQKKSLFPRHYEELEKLSKLKEIFPETFESSYIPSTGYASTKIEPLKSGAAALGGAVIGSTHPAAALSIPAAIFGAKAATNLLTSKKLRDLYLNKLKMQTENRGVGNIEQLLRNAILKGYIQNGSQGEQ